MNALILTMGLACGQPADKSVYPRKATPEEMAIAYPVPPGVPRDQVPGTPECNARREAEWQEMNRKTMRELYAALAVLFLLVCFWCRFVWQQFCGLFTDDDEDES